MFLMSTIKSLLLPIAMFFVAVIIVVYVLLIELTVGWEPNDKD